MSLRRPLVTAARADPLQTGNGRNEKPAMPQVFLSAGG